ncbi:hypothetical protein Q1695_012195 [Nippostrongylus brasiliensis]|nr:hypothetical protein Q1695_012195 [Nippostrongylus brasiliensis]
MLELSVNGWNPSQWLRHWERMVPYLVTHALAPDTDVPTRTSVLTVEESVITVASAPGQLIGRHATDGCKRSRS